MPPKSSTPRQRKADASDSERGVWRRDTEALDLNGKLGRRIRDRREMLEMSLQEASESTGIAAATLSRIENNKMAPTISLVMKIVKGLNVSLTELLGEAGLNPPSQQLSFAFPNETPKVHVVKDEYEPRHSESGLSQSVAPVIFEVSAKRLDQIGGLAGHPGVEFSYVLSGTLVMHFAGHPEQELPTGASVLFDSSVPHAYLAKGRVPARVLTLLVRDPIIHDVSNLQITRLPKPTDV